MKIIILAAGRGERLMPFTQNTPKPLLDMGNGLTLLEEQIKSIKTSGVIDEIVLVIGYLAEQIEAKIKLHLQNGIRIQTIFNPFYDVSNNLMSLWLARHVFDDDFMITNGDNLFVHEVFSELYAQNDYGIFLAVNHKKQFDNDDMKVDFDDGVVAEVSKSITPSENNAESPGLAMVRGKRPRRIFFENLEALVRDKTSLNSFWLEIFNLLYKNGVSVHPWFFDGDKMWQEVDYHVDLDELRKLLKIRLPQYDRKE